MEPEEFRKFFIKALTDEGFRKELAHDAFGVLERYGLDTSNIPEDIRSVLARLPFDECQEEVILEKATGTTVVARKPRCGVCGVCGVCSLCGEVNFGSGSAALWALFHIFSVGPVRA
jgi:hypothetical protein